MMIIGELIRYTDTIEGERQSWKVEHKLSGIVVTVLLATPANANTWCEIAEWAKYNDSLLKKFIELPNGTASHDTIQRVMERIQPEKFQGIVGVWREL